MIPLETGAILITRRKPQMAKILIVDDEKDIRKLVGIYLKRQGYQILEAENGKQAIDLVRENSDIDLIIMDIMMPEMSGT